MTATTLEPGRASAREARYFYVWTAGACVAVAFLGFAPTYWARVAAGSFKAAPIIHIHGLLFSSWTLFFFAQTWLVARGDVTRHRAMGLIGVSLATAMCIIGVLAAMRSMAHATELDAGLAGREFAVVSLSAIAFFAICVVLAIANVGRPETHKRLMLLVRYRFCSRPPRAGFSFSWRRRRRAAYRPPRPRQRLSRSRWRRVC